MTSQMQIYKAELNQRYWQYQKIRFPEWERFFERPQTLGIRPPVFTPSEAWRNVIVNPNTDRLGRNRLLALVPESERHKWFRSMNSSQALAQSVFGNLALSGNLDCLLELQDNEGCWLFGETHIKPEKFEMEFKINYLGEPRRTSLDCFFGGDKPVAIECKFTEPEVGTCSRPRLTRADSNYEQDHCNGNYSKQRLRTNRCSLTEIGVLYWRYIPMIFHWNNNQDHLPCPLFENYQLVRNIIAISVKPDGAVSLSNGHAVLIYDDRNPAFQNGGKGLTSFNYTQKSLLEPHMLLKCSWQQIIEHMRDKGILSWLTEELRFKYGL
jgi:hypothetical protein